MGREIRRVPVNWQHPTQTCPHAYKPCEGYRCYKPLFDRLYQNEAKEWLEEFDKWQKGYRPDYFEIGDAEFFWDWYGMPPDKEYYRTYKDEDAIWYQVYETVSEGTPVTPPFETQAELVNYLVENGDFWAQRRNQGGFTRKAAENFVYGSGYAPSMVVCNGEVTVGIETCK